MKSAAALLFVFSLSLGSLVSAAEVSDKKLIEFGWDEPDTGFMRQHIAEMERSPFDGCVFHININTTNRETARFTWSAWGRRAFTLDELQPAINDLKGTAFHRFTANFLRFNVTPGVDWFEDFSAIAANARLAGLVAKAGNCPGILFDVEAYDAPLFDFRKQRDAATKSWEDYQAQVRQRGREVMAAFQQGFPGLTVFLTFGYTLPWEEMQDGNKPLRECKYGLLPALLDGMLEAAEGSTRLLDGCENAYSYKDPRQFERAYRKMKYELLPIVANTNLYARNMSFGFGLWMDFNSQKHAWDTADLSKNYFSPRDFETSVRKALQVSDGYVWIYTQSPQWWSKTGHPEKLPEAYDQALRKARLSAP